MLTLMILSNSCTSLANSSLAPVESRTYDICEDLTGFCWQYNKCIRHFLGFCTKSEISLEKVEVEFKDKIQAKQLYDMNFILKVRQKPI
jgi:hypothetical protein